MPLFCVIVPFKVPLSCPEVPFIVPFSFLWSFNPPRLSLIPFTFQ